VTAQLRVEVPAELVTDANLLALRSAVLITCSSSVCAVTSLGALVDLGVTGCPDPDSESPQ
jgi:hypothetical protein